MITIGRSLYTRLVKRMGLVLSISGATLLIAIWISTQIAAKNVYDRLLVGAALQIAENIWYQNGAVNVDVPLASFSMLAEGDQSFYVVLDPAGRVIAGDLDFKPTIPWDKLASGPILQDGNYLDMPVRMAVIGRRMPVSGVHPWAVIVLAQTNNNRLSFAKNLATDAMILILVMGILTMIAAMFTLYQALSPLKKIEVAIRQRDLNDLNDLSTLSMSVPAETHALVSAINAFMQRLTVHRSLMRRVIGDAAHQLRTPVMALISQMELLSAETDETKRQHILARLNERTHHLGALVNQLINHAMVLHRRESVRRVAIDLRELVRLEMTEILSHQQSELDLEMQAPEHPCMILADDLSLREAIKNILNNALQYGARTLLHVRLTQQDNQWVLSFTDDGPGIAQAEWEHVKTPFASRTDGRVGASLGLSIVNEVMLSHRGHMQFGHTAEGYFIITLILPVH